MEPNAQPLSNPNPSDTMSPVTPPQPTSPTVAFGEGRVPEIIGTEKKFPLVPVILSLLLVATLIAGTFFFLRAQSLQKQLTMTISPTPTPTTSAESLAKEDPTANWQTYNNTKYNYTFKHPFDFTIRPYAGTQESPNEAGSYKLDTSKGETYANIDYIDSDNKKYPDYKLGMSINNYETYYASYAGGYGGEPAKNQVKILDGKKSITFTFNSQLELTDTAKQILNSFRFTSQVSNVPAQIDLIFQAINTNFSTNLVPTKETEFYSPQGFIKQESWKLVLNSVLTNKPQFNSLYQVLNSRLTIDNASSADGVGQSVQGYQNDQIYCYLLLGFNQSDYISCITK